MTLAIFLGTLLLCIFTGLPIAFSLLVTAVALMLHLHLFDPQIIALNLVNGVDSFPLMAVPFFLLAGELMNAGGISRRIVALASALVGHFRGGLGYVAIFAGVLMASMSGSAVADTAALGGLLLPMMVRSGYRPERAGGLVASAGIIAPIIPPSVAFVVFGVATNLSIGKLFLAGIAPGVLLSVALAVTWWVMTRNGDEALQEKVSGRERLRILGQSFWALMLPVIVIVGLRAGVFTPTEAAVVAAVYALLVSLFIYREISLGDLMPVFLAAARMTSVIMLLVASALVSAWLITIAQLPQQMVRLVEPFLDNRVLLLLVILAIVFAIGMVMDLTPIVLILGPILIPVVKAAGIDPIYFGVLFIICASIGLITPPVGTVLNVISGVGKIPIERAALGVLPFLGTHLLVLVLLVLFPGLVTYPLYNWFQ